MRVASAHLNGGFARAADLKAQDVLTDISGADEMIAGEEGAVAHMNEDHADAIRLAGIRLLGKGAPLERSMIGITDPSARRKKDSVRSPFLMRSVG